MGAHIPVQDKMQQPLQVVPDDNSMSPETSSRQLSTDKDAQCKTEVPSQPETEGLLRKSGRIQSQPRWMEDYVPL